MKKILFVCTGNSARSQMAEAFARAHGTGRVQAFSAGTDPKGLHPVAVEVMREKGIDPARARGSAGEVREVFRRSRDEIETRVSGLLAEIGE